MKKQQGNSLLWLVLVALVVFLAFWYFMKSGYKFPQQTAQGPSIMNIADLDSAKKDLDGTDLNQMDSGTNQVAADSASF